MELEKAILLLKTNSHCADAGLYNQWCEALDMAIAALRAQRDAAKLDRSRWEGCDACTPKEVFCNGQRANYCPFCGRPFTEEAWAELEWRIGP